MSDAVKLLSAERDRKTALRDSYQRQLGEIDKKRDQTREEMARLKKDMDKLKPPSAILQKEYEKLQQRDQYLAGEHQKIRSDINNMNKEIITLNNQVRQLGGG